MTLEAGEVGAIVGPSGCGKTTLLRIIAGLDHDFEGTVVLPAPARLGMVFQEPRLLPWRTVEQNSGLAGAVAERGLTRLSPTLGLSQHLSHFPGELSLGLARRVAIARAFAFDPICFCWTSPSSRSTRRWRLRLRAELLALVEARR